MLTTFRTSDLLPAVGMHSFVTAQVGKLGIGLHADLALERLDRAVDMLMLLQATRRRK